MRLLTDPGSSGKTTRHRLNRGGDRQANAALYRIVMVRLRYHQPTKDYMTRRLAQGKTNKEVIRCRKRYVAREVFAALNPTSQTNPTTPLTSIASDLARRVVAAARLAIVWP